MARLLLNAGASAAAPDRNGRTALDMAAWNAAPDLVAALLERGASAQAKDQAGLTPLHWLARGGHRGTVEDWERTAHVLVARGGSISAKDKDGRTPLAHAAQHPELFMELIGLGADPGGVTARERRASEAAFQAGCRTPAAWLAAKILGRYREADLLEYLDVGTDPEREAIRAGKSPDGGWRGVRYAADMSTGEVIDISSEQA